MGGIVSSLQSQKDVSTPEKNEHAAASAPASNNRVHFAEPVVQDTTPGTELQAPLSSAMKRARRRGRPRKSTSPRAAGQPAQVTANSLALLASPSAPAAPASPAAQAAARPSRASAGRRGRPSKKSQAAAASTATTAAVQTRGASRSAPGVRKSTVTKHTQKGKLQLVEQQQPTKEKRRPGRPRKNVVRQ